MSVPAKPSVAPRRRTRLLPAIAAIVVVATTASLGAWQLRRADEKRALHERRVNASVSPPVSVPGVPVAPADLDGRRVSVHGRFIAQRTVFVDNRTHKGVAGFHVATPVKIEDSDLHVLVLRGWIARDPRDRARLPDVQTPEGVVSIEGLAEATIAQALELQRAGVPAPQDRIWQNLSFDRFERWSGMPLQHVLVRQTDGEAFGDHLVRDWRDAGDDVDKHLGYAAQWYGLAVLTAGLWAYFTFFRRREHSADAR